jgi:fluoroquinolone resistance protein
MRQLVQSDLPALASEHELRGLSFEGLSLVGWDLADRVIEDCSFRDCVLTDARFNASKIRSCEFAGAGVQGVSLFAATLEECKMMGLDFTRGARFDAATFSRVNFDYTLLRGLDLTGVEFVGCSMRECDFTGGDLTNASLVDCDLTDADWSSVTTSSTDLRGSSARGLDLRRGPYGVILTTKQAVALVEDLGVRVFDPAE